MFIDTNVLVNSRVRDAPHHAAARDMLGLYLSGDEPMHISRQVIREYLSVMTRSQTWQAAVPLAEALEDASVLLRNFEVLEDGPEVTELLFSLCREVPLGGGQIHDANIVATMLAHEERRLLTFNAADFRRFGDLIELLAT